MKRVRQLYINCLAGWLFWTVSCLLTTVVAQEIKFEHFGTRQGMPSMHLLCILQDHLGLLWIGTTDGLVMYDGIRFSVFQHNPADSTSIPDNFVRRLYEDRAGTLWAATMNGGLLRFNRELQQFTAYKSNPNDPGALQSDDITSMYEDSQGNFWVGTRKGLHRMDRSTGKITRMPDAPAFNASIMDMLEDSQGRFWLGTNGGLFQWIRSGKQGENTFVSYSDSLTYKAVFSLFEDSHQNIWIGTYFNGVNCLDNATHSIRQYPPDPKNPRTISHKSVTSYYEAPDGRIWMGTNGGVSIFDPRTQQFTRHPHDPDDPRSLSSNFINDVYADRSGIVWVATFGGGLNKFNPYTAPFRHFYSLPNNPASLSYNQVTFFCEDSRGRIWVGTSNGLNKFDNQTGAFERYYYVNGKVADVNANEINAISEDQQGLFWIGTYNGLKQFDPQTGQYNHWERKFPQSPILKEKWFIELTWQPPGILWAGMNGPPTLGSFDTRSGVWQTNYLQAPKGVLASALLPDKDWIWLGTENGLIRLNTKTNDAQTFTHEPGNPESLDNSDIRCFILDKNQTLWVGTPDGLNAMPKGATGFLHYGARDGLPMGTVNGILEDDAGNLWISTSKGLSRFNPNRGTCRNYNYLDGLQDDIFNPRACMKSRTGEMYFGGVNGFNVFRPDALSDDTIPPPVIITGFRLLREEEASQADALNYLLPAAGEITLDWADKVFVFGFAALSYNMPEKNQYAIKMEGFDENWRYIGNRHEATYTNLSPGHYTFRVKAANKDGYWNEAGVSVRVIILAPWWRTWWAYLGYALAIAGLLYFMRRKEIQKQRLQYSLQMEQAEAIRLKELNDAKSIFLSTVSHELRTPLTSIMGFSKIIKKRLEDRILPFTDLTDLKQSKAAEQVLDNLGIVVSESERLTNLINDVLDLAKIEAGKVMWQYGPVEIEKIIRRAISATSTLFDQKGLEIIKAVEQPLPVIHGDSDRLIQVVVNLLSNAIKFTEKGSIRCSARLHQNQIVVSIADTGIGIAEKDLLQIFEKFKQVGDDTLTDKPGGTGLGLPICKEIVEHHGGRIWAESEIGTGSVFSFSLPVTAVIKNL